MLNLTVEELDKMLVKSSSKSDFLKSGLFEIESKLFQLHNKKSEAERNIKIEENKSEAIKEALVIINGVPKKVSTMRKVLLIKIDLAKREDITIADKRTLDSEIVDLKREIQKICNHPFVFQKDGYSGSSANEWEDSRPTERYCVVCGLEERAKDFHQNGRVDMIGSVFEVLKVSERRVVQKEPYRPYPQYLSHVDIWIPLGAVLKSFEDSVVKVLNS